MNAIMPELYTLLIKIIYIGTNVTAFFIGFGLNLQKKHSNNLFLLFIAWLFGFITIILEL